MLSLLFIRASSIKLNCRRKNHKRITIPSSLTPSSVSSSSSSSSSFFSSPKMRRSAPGALAPPSPAVITVVEQQQRSRRTSQGAGGEEEATDGGGGRGGGMKPRMVASRNSRWSAIFGGWGAGRGEEEEESGGAEELRSAVHALRPTIKMATKSAEAQLKGAEQLAKWAAKSGDAAMADVVGKVSELMRMHAKRQSTFAKDYEHYLKQLNKAADADRQVRVRRREVDKLGERERRLAKQMAAQRGGAGAEQRAQWEKVRREREWAERELTEERAEAEYARMAHLGAAIGGIGEVQLNLARGAQLIFACQRELAEFVPSRGEMGGGGARGDEQRGIRRNRQYEGVAHTEHRMTELRRALAAAEMELAYNAPSSVERRREQQQQQRHRRSEPPTLTIGGHQPPQRAQHRQQRQQQQQLVNPFGTPPPPYTPSAPPLDLLDSANRRPNNRHSTGALLFGDFNNTSTPSNPPPPSLALPMGRIYPLLPPNPFAEELKLRRRQRAGQ